MVTAEIQSDIEAIEKNSALIEETLFCNRTEAIDFIEFNVIDRIEGLLQSINPPEELITLKKNAERIQRQLEDIDNNLFHRLRADIRMGGCTGVALRNLINEYVGCVFSNHKQQDEIGYDSLDLFINGLLLFQTVPVETKNREPGMLYYQQTPARIIFELVDKANFTKEDVFYDLGSGLGQVPILVNLLSGIKAKGIEFEPAYFEYSKACASDLNLSRVKFINADAREADYSDGTIFYMYTPFEGRVMQEVLEKLRRESRSRRIRIFTYGPCTPQVCRQGWLKCVDQNVDHIYKLGVFRSLENSSEP